MRYRKPMPSDIGKRVELLFPDGQWHEDELTFYIQYENEREYFTRHHSEMSFDECRVPYDEADEQAQLCEAADLMADHQQHAAADWLSLIANANPELREQVRKMLGETLPFDGWNREVMNLAASRINYQFRFRDHQQSSGFVNGPMTVTFGDQVIGQTAEGFQLGERVTPQQCGMCTQPATHSVATRDGNGIVFLCDRHYHDWTRPD